MAKKLKWISVIVIMIFIILLLLEKRDKTVYIIANIKSKQKVAENNNNTTQVIKHEKKDIIKPQDGGYNFSDIVIERDLSYIHAFRNFTFILHCKIIIEDINKDKKPIESFRVRVNDFKKYGYTGGREHEQYFYQHVKNCRKYLDDDSETYEYIKAKLQYIYQNIEPITEEEKSLAQIITVIDKTSDLNTRLEIERKGLSVFTAKKISKIRAELQPLYSINHQINQLPDDQITAQQQIIISENKLKIKSLKKQISDSYVKDESLILDLSESYGKNRELLNNLLIKSSSADIFVLLFSFGLDYKAMEPYMVIRERILDNAKSQLKMSYRNYPTILFRSAVPLYACALGYPCGADSQVMLYHCISRVNYNACGKNVEDFYLNYYISPNTLEDVNMFLDFLFENYAKND